MGSDLVLLWALIRQLTHEDIEIGVTREVADAMLGVANDVYGEDFHDYLCDNLSEDDEFNLCMYVSYDNVVSRIPDGAPVPEKG